MTCMSEDMKNTANYQLVDRAVSGFVWLLTSTSAQHLTRLAVMMFLARLLSPNDFFCQGIILVLHLLQVEVLQSC